MRQMMRAIAVAVLVMSGGAALYAEDPRIPSDVFNLTVPEAYGAFTKQVQTTKSPEGDIETTNWISKAPTGEAVIVTMSRMPGRILDPQKLIASTRESLLKSLGATLESEEPRPGELPSSRLLFRSDAAWFRARFTVNEERFYQLLYVGRSADQRSSPGVGAIFDSFRLVDAAPAVEATPQS